MTPTDRHSPPFVLPKIEKDPFETVEEYRKRIDALEIVPAGAAYPDRRYYNIRSRRFPMTVEWHDWLKKLENPPLPADEVFIEADGGLARKIDASAVRHPVFVRLSTEKEKPVIAKIELIHQGTSIPVIVRRPGSEWVDPVAGISMIYVPGGVFQMGDIFGDGDADEIPVHEVYVDGFYIGKYPIIQSQWKTIMEGNNPSCFTSGEMLPVENVSWYDAKTFIERLMEYGGNRHMFRLPTEAEWEYAARSGGKTEKYAGGDRPDRVAWYGRKFGGSTYPVGVKHPNGLGLYDMSGNVWEWCEDIYGETAYRFHDRFSPMYLDGYVTRVNRGGGWSSPEHNIRTTKRDGDPALKRANNLGFRVVKI